MRDFPYDKTLQIAPEELLSAYMPLLLCYCSSTTITLNSNGNYSSLASIRRSNTTDRRIRCNPTRNSLSIRIGLCASNNVIGINSNSNPI